MPFALDLTASYSGSLGGSSTSGMIHRSGDAKGPTFKGSTVITEPGVTISADEVVIGDTTWVRPTGGTDWKTTPTDESQPIQPIVDLATWDVTYDELTYDSGVPLHRVTINRWTGSDFKLLGFKRAKVTLKKFEALVTNDGYPVSIELDYNITAHVGGELLNADYEVTYKLSDFNKDITIEPPI